MKYQITIEVETHDDELIGVKEQIAAVLENIASVRVTEIKEKYPKQSRFNASFRY